jgi:hypothetical protein
MTGALSKRQQARNEKLLQDLVQTAPGNNFCADCQTRNPCMLIPRLLFRETHLVRILTYLSSFTAWASWSVRDFSLVFLPLPPYSAR